MGLKRGQRECDRPGVHGDAEHGSIARRSRSQPRDPRSNSSRPLGCARRRRVSRGVPRVPGERLYSLARAGGGWWMAGTMKIRPKDECRWDLVALGEVMLLLDPGDGRNCTARTFD